MLIAKMIGTLNEREIRHKTPHHISVTDNGNRTLILKVKYRFESTLIRDRIYNDQHFM